MLFLIHIGRRNGCDDNSPLRFGELEHFTWMPFHAPPWLTANGFAEDGPNVYGKPEFFNEKPLKRFSKRPECRGHRVKTRC